MQGLESVALGHSISEGDLNKALKALEDQFFDTASAGAAFKNLLTRMYTLDQAMQTITRLKDAAAFDRQAHLGLADAVVMATADLKEEISQLADNAGVTKNVAKMHEDYAKARGISTNALTQQMKIEAEYLGIGKNRIQRRIAKWRLNMWLW